MAPPTRIHADKSPFRRHFIEEWATLRGFKKAAHFAAAVGVDKSQVSRWYKGQAPRDDILKVIAGVLQLEDPNSLFRHPDDDWLSRLFADRSEADRKRLKDAIAVLVGRQSA